MCDACQESYERVMNQGSSKSSNQASEARMYEIRRQESQYTEQVQGAYN